MLIILQLLLTTVIYSWTAQTQKQRLEATLHFPTFTQNIWGENVIQISEDNLFEEIEDLYQVIELGGPGPVTLELWI